MNTKISVIVPSFNQGPFIENCIKSVIGQTYNNWELIIQDGASNDNTIEICKRYASIDNRIIFKTEKDKGYADAVNKAIDISSGELGIIQSSDDFFACPSVFGDVIEIYAKNSHLNLITGACIILNEKLQLLKTSERTEKFVINENIYTMHDNFSQSATFFSLERAKIINKLDPTLDMVADTDFWIRLCCSKPITINSVYQTSRIWGAVVLQPEQRSSELYKFYLGRAKMACKHSKDPLLPYDPKFKNIHANNIIKQGILHYSKLNKDINDLKNLYFEINNLQYKESDYTFKSLMKNKIQKIYFKLKKTNIKNTDSLINAYEVNGPLTYHKWF